MTCPRREDCNMQLSDDGRSYFAETTGQKGAYVRLQIIRGGSHDLADPFALGMLPTLLRHLADAEARWGITNPYDVAENPWIPSREEDVGEPGSPHYGLGSVSDPVLRSRCYELVKQIVREGGYFHEGFFQERRAEDMKFAVPIPVGEVVQSIDTRISTWLYPASTSNATLKSKSSPWEKNNQNKEYEKTSSTQQSLVWNNNHNNSDGGNENLLTVERIMSLTSPSTTFSSSPKEDEEFGTPRGSPHARISFAGLHVDPRGNGGRNQRSPSPNISTDSQEEKLQDITSLSRPTKKQCKTKGEEKKAKKAKSGVRKSRVSSTSSIPLL